MKVRKLKTPNMVTTNALTLADEILDATPTVAIESSPTNYLLTAIAYALLGIGEELKKHNDARGSE